MPFWKDSTKVPFRMIWVVSHKWAQGVWKRVTLTTHTDVDCVASFFRGARTHNVLNSVVRQGWRVLDRKSQTCYSHSVVTPKHDSIWTRKFIFLGVDQWKNYSFWISQNNIWNPLVFEWNDKTMANGKSSWATFLHLPQCICWEDGILFDSSASVV